MPYDLGALAERLAPALFQGGTLGLRLGVSFDQSERVGARPVALCVLEAGAIEHEASDSVAKFLLCRGVEAVKVEHDSSY